MDFRDKCSSQTASVLNRHILLRINHYVAKIAVSGPGKWVRSLFKVTQWFGRWHGEMLREYRLGPSIPHVSQEGGPRRSSLPENNPEPTLRYQSLAGSNGESGGVQRTLALNLARRVLTTDS